MTQTVEDFASKSTLVSDRWRSFDYEFPVKGMDIGFHFGQTWSVQNAMKDVPKPNIKSSSVLITAGALSVPFVAIAAAAPYIGIPMLVGAGLVGGASKLIAGAQERNYRDAVEKIKKNFERMQTDTIQLLESFDVIALSIAANPELSENERIQQLNDLNDELNEFSIENFKQDLNDIDLSMKGMPKAIKMTKKSFEKVKELRDSGGNLGALDATEPTMVSRDLGLPDLGMER